MALSVFHTWYGFSLQFVPPYQSMQLLPVPCVTAHKEHNNTLVYHSTRLQWAMEFDGLMAFGAWPYHFVSLAVCYYEQSTYGKR